MATTIPSAELVPITPVFTNTERLALAGFLAGYSGLTRQAYELDLGQFASWCQQHQLHLFGARRADIEFFARDPWRPAGGPGPPLPGGCARWLGSTATPSRKNSSITRLRRMCGGRGWITSRTPPAWTAMSSVRSWSPRDLARRWSMR